LAVDAHRTIRRRQSFTTIDRWILARKIVQGLALFAFLTLIVLSRRSAAAPVLISLPLRLDPLVTLAALLSSKVILSGSAVALAVVLLTLVSGRTWCGWLCPMGTLLDVFSFKRLRRAEMVPPETWRSIKYTLLFIILLAAFFGNLTLLVLDPLTIVYRSFTLAAWPALDQIVTAVETALYPVPFLSKAVIAFDRWARPNLLPTAPIFYREALLFGALLAGIILLNRIVARFWCRYLCPLGGMLGLISKFSIFRRQVATECKRCGICEHNCPTGTIDPRHGYASDAAECIMCLECLQSCPRSSIQKAPVFRPAASTAYDPGRRHALVALVVSAGAIALLRSDAHAKHDHQFLLRPPGADPGELLQTCVRCGACMAACPTSALQPAILEAGFEGLWTPVVVPRMGYCDYSCQACGSVCPVQAIPNLGLEEKRVQVIGKATIDQNRCLAWGNMEDCIICEEMCPISNKAIHLQRTEVTREDGNAVFVLLPYVERERCIGCGICENKCPVSGEAAIRVYIEDQQRF
jgi:polyferredoxin